MKGAFGFPECFNRAFHVLSVGINPPPRSNRGSLFWFIFISIAVWSVLLGQPQTSHASDADWPFPQEPRSRLVFVHPMVNYAINPLWQRDWERQLVSAHGVQITSGSVATQDLYTNLMVNITEPVGDRFRFLYRSVWRDGLHIDLNRQENWIGLEMGIFQGTAIYFQVNPTPDKEDFDFLIGLQLVDKARERYLRLGLRLDDFMYEQKNDRGGISLEEAVAIQWELRYQLGRWELFSTGRYGSGSHRAFPDSTVSQVVAESFRRDAASTTRLRYVWSDLVFAVTEVSHYNFNASEVGRDETTNFEYVNEYIHFRTLGILGVGGPWVLRPEIHWLRQWASNHGENAFTHTREDFFPALFVELQATKKSTWELGYMAVHHQWNYCGNTWSSHRNGHTDKIKVGWTFAFLPSARVQLSLSHELDLQRFGGGNAQLQINF